MQHGMVERDRQQLVRSDRRIVGFEHIPEATGRRLEVSLVERTLYDRGMRSVSPIWNPLMKPAEGVVPERVELHRPSLCAE